MKQILLAITVLCTLVACNTSKISGTVNYVNKDTVGIDQYQFVIPGNTLQINDSASFKSSLNRHKINARIIYPKY
jgi:hypothetical protein